MDMEGGVERRGVIEAAGVDADAGLALAAREARAAIAAETALVLPASPCFGEVVAQRAARDGERFTRHVDNGRVRRAGDLLAVAAVAREHHERLGGALVADGAAAATAGEGDVHGDGPRRRP